jgi:hypothetical protein
MSISRPLVAFALILGSAGCAPTEVRPRPDSTPHSSAGGPSTKGGVELEVDVPATAFEKDGKVTISVWNPKQLALLESSSDCSVSSDRSGKEETHCPNGETYEKPSPEVFEVKASELASTIHLHASSLGVGDRYRVSIGGRANDGCNQTGGEQSGEAAATITVRDLQLATTDMACVPAKGREVPES